MYNRGEKFIISKIEQNGINRWMQMKTLFINIFTEIKLHAVGALNLIFFLSFIDGFKDFISSKWTFPRISLIQTVCMIKICNFPYIHLAQWMFLHQMKRIFYSITYYAFTVVDFLLLLNELNWIYIWSNENVKFKHKTVKILREI